MKAIVIAVLLCTLGFGVYAAHVAIASFQSAVIAHAKAVAY